MGTHMWSTSQPSRRGRRMSLELPHPPIPLTAKDSEFLQRRPELFFPYIQTPFSSASAAPSSTVSSSYLHRSPRKAYNAQKMTPALPNTNPINLCLYDINREWSHCVWGSDPSVDLDLAAFLFCLTLKIKTP